MTDPITIVSLIIISLALLNLIRLSPKSPKLIANLISVITMSTGFIIGVGMVTEYFKNQKLKD
jgi:hypothetical protein